MLECLFNKVAGKKLQDSNTGVFLQNIAKFLRPPILKNIWE